jgi:hypothetical protein
MKEIYTSLPNIRDYSLPTSTHYRLSRAEEMVVVRDQMAADSCGVCQYLLTEYGKK